MAVVRRIARLRAGIARWIMPPAQDGTSNAQLQHKIGQLYQVLGDRLMGDPSPASDAEIQRALDYAADTDRFDPDFLPWPDPHRAEFEEWYAKLEAAAKRRGWPDDYIRGTGKACWRDYFFEGDSPDAALNMDASYGEPG